MVSDTIHPKEKLGTWTEQHCLLRLRIPNAQEHNARAYCDGGATFSYTFDHAVERLGLQDSVRKHHTYKKWNGRYLRCLHKLCESSMVENGIRGSKWRHIHKIVTSVTSFKKETHILVRRGQQTDGLVYSMGLLPVEYILIEQLPKGVNHNGPIPDKYWVPREFDVIFTKDKENQVDCDVVLGQSEGIFSQSWWLAGRRVRRQLDE